MALMLAGSVISQVFNTLGSVFGNVVGFVIISLIGNALNLALNLLGCYVHDLPGVFRTVLQGGRKSLQPSES